MLERARALAPKEVKPRLVLASLRNSIRQPDRARDLVADIQANHGSAPLDPKVQADLAFIEAATWLLKTNSAKALAILQPMLDAEPVDSLIYDRAKTLFMQFGDRRTALRVADQEVRLTPNSLGALMDNGILHFELRESLQRHPHVQPRAFADEHLPHPAVPCSGLRAGWPVGGGCGHCREALRLAPAASAPYYHLAGIFGRQGDTNAAKQFYQQGLSNDLRDADQQLLTTPDNLQALELKTTSYLRGGDFSNAIPVLTRVLSLTNVYAARLYRGMAYRRTRQWDAARSRLPGTAPALPPAPTSPTLD